MEHLRRQENIEPQEDGRQMKARAHESQQPQPPAQSCPRCGSSHTKFCYYNNYSFSQPRYNCMACKRKWTQGGALRNIPIGRGCRKHKRSLTIDVARAAHSLPVMLLPPQNYAGVNLVPSSMALRPVMRPICNSFFGGDALFSSSSMQTIPIGITQGAVVEGGGSHMVHFLETSLPFVRPQVPHQFQPQNNSSQKSMVFPRPVVSWTQSLITCMASNSVANSWSGDNDSNIVDGGDQDDFSFSLNHEWFTSPDRYPEFGALWM